MKGEVEKTVNNTKKYKLISAISKDTLKDMKSQTSAGLFELWQDVALSENVLWKNLSVNIGYFHLSACKY